MTRKVAPLRRIRKRRELDFPDIGTLETLECGHERLSDQNAWSEQRRCNACAGLPLNKWERLAAPVVRRTT